MLPAIIKNKLARYLVRGGEPPEDLVTDCFFGPLRYLNEQDAGRAVSWICQGSIKPAFQFLEGAFVKEVELWPRRSRVEPDALLRLTSSSGANLLLLIEVKWNAPLGETQALRQWREFHDSERSAYKFLQLIICRSRTSVAKQLEQEEKMMGQVERQSVDLWRRSRLVLTWYDVAKRLRDIPTWYSEQLQRWAQDVRAVLKVYGERPFEGFSPVSSLAVMPRNDEPLFWAYKRIFDWPSRQVEQHRGELFWRAHRRKFNWPLQQLAKSQSEVFWRKEF